MGCSLKVGIVDLLWVFLGLVICHMISFTVNLIKYTIFENKIKDASRDEWWF